MPDSLRFFRSCLLVFGVWVLAFGPVEILGAQSTGLHSILVDSMTESMTHSVKISLQEEHHGELVQWLRKLSPIQCEFHGNSLEEFASSFGEELDRKLIETNRQGDQAAIQSAVERSVKFLGLDGRPLAQLISKAEIPLLTTPQDFTRTIDDLTSTVQAVCWKDVDGYARNRLGPLRAILSILRHRDKVILTTVRGSKALSLVPDVLSFTRYTLPLSSYGKEITFALRQDGSRALVLSNFDSRAYLLHFGLLISRFRYSNSLQFTIAEHIDESSLEVSYGQLLDFARTRPKLFSSIDGVVVGYTDAFSRAWSRFLVDEALGEGNSCECWGLKVYRFPEGKEIGLLSGDVDYYGEGLARQLERLHSQFPLKQIFFAGSGGAAIALPPYGIYFPSDIKSSDGCTRENVLMRSRNAGSHVSVDSPLLETPSKLWEFQRRRIVTVDMEAGHLASFASRFDVELGVGILVTDFPVGFGSLSSSLENQNFGAKEQARKDFVTTVENYVRNGRHTYLHDLEKWSDKTILELSLQNLHRYRDEIGALTREEQAVVSRLFSLPFQVTIHMSPRSFALDAYRWCIVFH